ncbi:ATPase [Maribellus sp. YY47]|uniref:ATPase n=1 Tax=Maribellus sp. YY47 TaxID=2929486 RepID=UPI0020018414|nr:ATPase [Maribellus sp. YY47]MCK3683109.1 ATPase [Maribellus sp. YY47]
MTILIADSGSTKTDWLYTDAEGNSLLIQTKGLNPFFRSSDDIYQELKGTLFSKVPEVDKVFFYGAGVINAERGDVIKAALAPLYPDAKVETNSDLLAAARALFQHSKGIACILGTGSNASLYNGENIEYGVPPLGFILGDECSGSALGKKLLGDYFKNVMPEDLKERFQQKYKVTQAEVLDKVYRTERPNKYLAGFAPFVSENISEKYCEDLVKASFCEFVDRNVLQIPDATQYPIGFSGSIAWNFRAIIESTAREYGFQATVILQKPIEHLHDYHTNPKK